MAFVLVWLLTLSLVAALPVNEANTATANTTDSRVVKMSPCDLRKQSHANLSKNMMICFGSASCKHSRRMEPILEDLTNRIVHRQDIEVIQVDVSDDPQMRKEFGINGYPTILLFKRNKSLGQQPLRFSGTRSRVNLQSWLEYHIESQPTLAQQVAMQPGALIQEPNDSSELPDEVCMSGLAQL
eukprot:c21160_g1_i1.p1 GENE.c21160_g1_i1~~c21160_g1_i1.p1  ORF type:complete len:184 (+),score=21.89 c21160_g1_i1:40-591(+)